MATTDKSPHEEAEKGPQKERAEFWHKEISNARERHKDWIKTGQRVENIYRGESEENLEVFNILWANTEVLKPTVYAKTPKPEVQRRHLQSDPTGEDAAEVLEKTASTALESSDFDFDREIEKAVEDFLVPGRGQVRIVYKPTIEEDEFPSADDDGNEITEKTSEKVFEEVRIEYVYWRDFLHSSGRSWSRVWWVGFASDMSREDLIEQFGNKGKNIPLAGEVDFDDTKKADKHKEKKDEEGYARVWEIWDKRARKRLFVSEGHEDIIDEDDDPLNLGGFFPCSEPLYSISSNKSLEPVPEYRMYQDQAKELNILTRRINRLTDALKVRGVYDSSITSIPQIFSGEENELIADDNYSKLVAMGGLENAIAFAPITIIADVLTKLTQRRNEVMQVVYQITGLSDIIRGFSDPRESATASRMKGQYGTMRIQKRQKKVQRFARDVIRIMCEVIAEFFEAETLLIMSGVKVDNATQGGMDQIVKRLRSDKIRDFTIDVETDSTIMLDEQERREEATTFLGAIGQFMQQAMGAVEAGIMSKEAAKELILFVSRRFDAGRDVQNILRTIGEGKPKEDPMAKAAMAKQQMEQQKLALQQEELKNEITIEMEKLKLEYAKLEQAGEIASAKNDISLMTEMIRQRTVEINAAGGSGESADA